MLTHQKNQPNAIQSESGEAIHSLNSQVEMLLTNNVNIPSKNRYEVATCINRLKRISDYADLINVLNKNQHQNEVTVLQIYIRYEEAMIRKILKPYNINFDEIPIKGDGTNSFSPDTINKPNFKKTDQSEALVLCTDLFRDFDDWLVLINTILVGKYREIILITSNEVNGECAKVAASYVPLLTQMSKDIHGFEPTISVYRGLESFDFADNKHEPPKEYDARMRLLSATSATHGSPQPINHLSDLYSKIKLLKENNHQFDLISIGKIAEHDIVWLLLDAIGFVPNKDIILGAKPTNVRGTNTNGPIHHLSHLRENCMMLDSRYGNTSLIRKEMFQDAVDLINEDSVENPIAILKTTNFNQGEKYLYRLLLALFNRGKESNSSKQIANTTLQHLSDLQYPTGEFYDVYALASALASNVDSAEKEILFVPDKGSDIEHPVCAIASQGSPNNQAKKVRVRYPNLQQLDQFIHESLINKICFAIDRSKDRMSFRKTLENMSENNKKLLAYYGNWFDEPSRRASLSCTGVDEYAAIRQSLYIMHIIMSTDTVEDIMVKLSNKYSEDGFYFDGINPNSEKEKADFISNLQAMLKMKSDLKNKWQNEFEEKLISVFLHHDLGKQVAFVEDNNLNGPNKPVAAGNESYLRNYFKSNENIAKDFETASKWIDIIDGLGYNPKKLLSAGYVGLLTSVDKTLDYLHQLNNTNKDLNGNNVEALNYYLFNKAKELGLNTAEFEFLKSENSKRMPWTNLSFDQQQKVVMLVLASPLIFVKPPLNKEIVTNEFIEKWQQESNSDIVKQMTVFMVNNMSSTNPTMLYNITGAIHHTSAQGGSHFANGGTVDELFSVFFPYVLKAINGNLKAEQTSCSFNKYQLLQGIEVFFAMMQNLLDSSQLMTRTINFASPENKNNYLKELASSKDKQEDKSVKLVAFIANTDSPIYSKQAQLPQGGAQEIQNNYMSKPKM